MGRGIANFMLQRFVNLHAPLKTRVSLLREGIEYDASYSTNLAYQHYFECLGFRFPVCSSASWVRVDS